MEGHGGKVLGLLSLHPGSSQGGCVLGYILSLQKKKKESMYVYTNMYIKKTTYKDENHMW